MREHLIIAGGGQAAVQATQSVREQGFDGRITLVTEEATLPYQRPPLSKKFLAGDMDRERLLLKPETFYATREIDVMPDVRVTAIDPARRTVSIGTGESLEYSHLLLATGSSPRMLRVPGVGLEGIFYLRSLEDVERIRQEFSSGKRLLVVGGGYIGLEVAAVAVRHGLDVTVLEAAERVMARSTCATVAGFFSDRHREAGVDLKLATGLTAFRGDRSVRQAETASGRRIDCDLVVIGIGIVPRTGLAQTAGLSIDNGIAVDPDCRSSLPGIFAAGDCTSHVHPWVGSRVRLESVQNAIEQGKAAAAAITGKSQPFVEVPWFWSDQYEFKLQIAGLAPDYEETVVRGSLDDGRFSVYYLRRGRVMAVDSVNSPRDFFTARKRLPEKPRWPAAAIADPDCDLAELAA